MIYPFSSTYPVQFGFKISVKGIGFCISFSSFLRISTLSKIMFIVLFLLSLEILCIIEGNGSPHFEQYFICGEHKLLQCGQGTLTIESAEDRSFFV